MTRTREPKRGAKETTARDTTIPNAAPRTAPGREIRTAWAPYTAATFPGVGPRLRKVAISRARAWTSRDIAAYTRRAITRPMTSARSCNVAWICATPARTKPTAPIASIRVRPNRETIDGSRVAFVTIAWTDPPCTRAITARRCERQWADG